ncbi:MAG: branched-chain amino acid ABC transporter permease [Bacteroidetes bacterium]|nr:branched-chain amino acid ABC transporter permease [Bacteroidota bacterium]
MYLSQLVQYLATGVTLGSTYALVGLGFTIIFAVTGIINFAQGEFVMLGGMLTFILLHEASLPMPLAIVVAVALTAGVGLLLERLAIRPARNASVVSLIIITVGASILIRGIAGQLWGKDSVPIPAFSGEQPIPLLGAAILPQSLWVLGTTVAVMVLLHLFFSYTMLGKALRACAVNRRGAGLVGINASAMSALSFTLSAALGAIGGIVVSPMTMTSYDVGTMLGLKGFVAAAMGGFTNQIAAVIGGVGLGVLEALGAGYISSAYKDAIALLVLFLVLVGRSFGLFKWGSGE